MTPRTRTSNQSTNFKVYYSKKVPRQVHFPHKKKTVRRLDSIEQDGVDLRQMRFLPKAMKQQKIDEKEESEKTKLGKGSTLQEATNVNALKSIAVHKRKGKKRQSEDTEEGSESDGGIINTSSKRPKRTTAVMMKRPLTAYDNRVVEEPGRTLRLQSTMTQFADGRRPSFGTNEPEFKPLKRCSRVSWGETDPEKERDKKQRTLTQMIPGIGRLSKEELDELSHLDEELEECRTNDRRVSQCLAEQGLLDLDTASHETAPTQLRNDTNIDSEKAQEDDEFHLRIVAYDQSSTIAQSAEEVTSDDNEEDYQPTQFIEAPSCRVRQLPGRRAKIQCPNRSNEPRKSAKSRFSLLSTPEKRQIFEIPSSQSPSESILLSQTSPPNSDRSTLRERNSRVTGTFAETPSKRRQVTFRELTAQPVPSTCLKKFGSTIQDSEDEGGSDIEGDSMGQGQIGNADQIAHSQPIGADMQTMPNRIDRTVAHGNKDLTSNDRDCSEGLKESAIRRWTYESSSELGGSWAPVIYDDDGPEYQSYRSVHSTTELQPFRDAQTVDASLKETPLILDLTYPTQPGTITKGTGIHSSMPPAVELQTDKDVPSLPMVIRDDSDDGKVEPEPMPLRAIERAEPSPPSVAVLQSIDLDDESVQVSCSPSVDRETQKSYSSKAEQQLQNEWLSYSQYINEGAPDSSSMRATTGAFSYNATPQLPRTSVLTASSARVQYSQATTIDEVTPKKNRTQLATSSNTTPYRISKSRPLISPDKPPSLFIPSSFPSPSRVAMEGWSSPVMGRTQNLYGSSQVLGSLEDFSIPLPPPIEDD